MKGNGWAMLAMHWNKTDSTNNKNAEVEFLHGEAIMWLKVGQGAALKPDIYLKFWEMLIVHFKEGWFATEANC